MLIAFFLVLTTVALISAAPLNDDQKKFTDAQVKLLQPLGSDPVVIEAFKALLAAPPAQLKDMTQEKWAKLSILSAEIKLLSKNPLADYLRSKKTPAVTELFVSNSLGEKVAFLAKTTSYSHKGKDKHDKAMEGKVWYGEPELDDSTGKIQVQVSFPILDAGKAIGSIVIGLDLALLK